MVDGEDGRASEVGDVVEGEREREGEGEGEREGERERGREGGRGRETESAMRPDETVEVVEVALNVGFIKRYGAAFEGDEKVEREGEGDEPSGDGPPPRTSRASDDSPLLFSSPFISSFTTSISNKNPRPSSTSATCRAMVSTP